MDDQLWKRVTLVLGLFGGALMVAHGCGNGLTSNAPAAGNAAGAAGASVGGNAGSDGAADVTESDATLDGGCYRDPYLPERYEPPCDQPVARANCSDGWCTVEPGCFLMGSPWCEWGRGRDTENPIQVTLTHRFRIQTLELTQGEWKALELPNPSTTVGGVGDCMADDCPVGNVNWFEALAFANSLSRARGLPECYVLGDCTGNLGEGMVCDSVRSTSATIYECTGLRLPTGAEWEYAARAGTRTTVYTGDVIERAPPYVCADDPILSPIAWYCANSGSTTHPGGGKQPNGWGLHDLVGNAAEWTGSIDVAYEDGPHLDWGAHLDAIGLREASALVQVKGGGYNQWPNTLRVGSAPGDPPGGRGPGSGFRLAQTLP